MVTRSLVYEANRVVPIVLACSWVGVEVPECIWDRPSPKLRCPFGWVYHDDHGIEAAFRVYQHKNSAFCFAEWQFFRPVSLFALAHDLDPDAAAKEMLRRYGWRSPDLEDQWRELVERPAQVDTAELERALKVYMSRKFDNWPACQYDDLRVARFLSRCLGLLEHVTTPRQADLWRSEVWRAVDRFAARGGDNDDRAAVPETGGLADAP